MKKTTKLLSLLLAVMMVVTAIVIPTVAANLDTIGYQASAVEAVDLTGVADIKDYASNADATAFKVTDADGWIAFSALVNGGNDLTGVTIYVANDIDFTGKTVSPVGNFAFPGADAATKPSTVEYIYFNGTLDGQGHKFTNLVMNYKATASFGIVALIGAINSSATIKNLILDSSCSFTLTGTEIKSPDSYVLCAGFVGYGNQNTNRIENCWNKADVTNAYGVAGGIMARKYVAEIKNCTNTGTITSNKNIAGGIFGGSNDGTPVKFTNCINYGDVTGAGAYVGGICGRTEKGTTITNCVNGGAITSTNASGIAAGIIVVSKNATIKMVNTANYGLITATATNGLVAAKSGVTVTEKEWSGNEDLYGTATLPPIVEEEPETPVDPETPVEPEIPTLPAEAVTLSALLADTTLYDTKDTFYLSTADDLKALSTLVNVNNITFSGKTILLNNNLDMSGITDFVPVGRWAYASDGINYNTAGSFAFMGIFDGQNYTISNLHVTVTLDAEDEFNTAGNNRAQDALAAVLFARAENATIKNLKVVSSSVTHNATVNRQFGFSYTAGLVACCNKKPVYLQDLELDIDVTGFYHVGGVMGSGPVRGSIKRTTRDGLVKHTGNSGYVGGFYAYGAAAIQNSVNLGDVYVATANPDAGLPVAALFIGASDATPAISDCTNYGEFLGNGGNAIFFANAAGKTLGTATNCVNKSIAMNGVPFVALADGTSYDDTKATNCSNDTSYVADMLKVSYQTKAGTTKGTAVRIITTVDSLNYEKLIYTITANGKTVTISETGVYSSILADGEEITDVAKYGIEGSDYFATFTLDNITGVESFTVQVTVVVKEADEVAGTAAVTYSGGAYTVSVN